MTRATTLGIGILVVAWGCDAAPDSSPTRGSSPPSTDPQQGTAEKDAESVDAPPAPGGPWPHEPAGSTTLLDCPFDTTTCEGKIRDPYKSSGYSLNVVNEPGAPLSPSNVVKSTRFANVASGGTQLEYEMPTGTKDVFVGVWWRTNPEFMGKNHSGNKLFFIRGQGPGTNGVFLFMWRTGVTPVGHLRWTTQLSYNLDQCKGAPDIDECDGDPNVAVMPGVWYRIEVYMHASSTPTAHDGIVRWWITPKGGTPTLAGNYTNFAYGPAVDAWVWSETWDGSGPPNEWTTEGNHFVDHLRISAPTCPSNGCSL